ncbi:hypothetical protein BJX65DRAFT_290210 [Aspergillus insuetus]
MTFKNGCPPCHSHPQSSLHRLSSVAFIAVITSPGLSCSPKCRRSCLPPPQGSGHEAHDLFRHKWWKIHYRGRGKAVPVSLEAMLTISSQFPRLSSSY